MNEEWVSTATDLLCCSDEEVGADEMIGEEDEADASSLRSTLESCSGAAATDGASAWHPISDKENQHKDQQQEQEEDGKDDGTSAKTERISRRDEDGESRKLRDELQEFVSSVFRTEMQRLTHE